MKEYLVSYGVKVSAGGTGKHKKWLSALFKWNVCMYDLSKILNSAKLAPEEANSAF